MQWVYLSIGLLGMLAGANWLVRGCVAFARRMRVSEFVVSVIIIGIGTSLPELMVSLISGTRDLGALVVSNNIGSNIINILGILGLGAILRPIVLSGKKHLGDLFFLGLASVVFAVMVWTAPITQTDGVMLLLILAAYFIWEWMRDHSKKRALSDKRKPAKPAARAPEKAWEARIFRFATADGTKRLMTILLMILAGVAALYACSEIFMNALEKISKANNLSQTMAGILIVAPGTAVPELLVTVIAAIRVRPEIAIGNIIGSNLMNIVLVVAFGAIVADLPVPARLANFDIWVMLGAAALLYFNLLYHRRLSRATGALYLTLLAAYLWAAVVIH
ncbi:MAG: hypothetical protein FWC61_02255 [Proteobacteria bacterium]|nr:hypothetical protein [Pseudomonadota bacterium]